MPDLNTLLLPELYRELSRSGLVARAVELARDEDMGPQPGTGDITSTVTVPEDAEGEAVLVARAAGVVAGLAVLPEIGTAFGGRVRFETRTEDGRAAGAGEALATLRGPLRDLLALERTALNFIGRLSGIATRTAEFLKAMGKGHRAALYDTRKTTPGIRVLEKYAVRCGGGRSHRLGLFDAVLIKDNHIAGVPPDRLRGVVAEAAARARALRPGLSFVEVEVDSLPQLEQVLSLEPGVVDIVLLDNMETGQLRSAVAMRDRARSRPELEASGGVRLETVRAIAMTGVDRISAGALTHSAYSLDVALDVVRAPARGGPGTP